MKNCVDLVVLNDIEYFRKVCDISLPVKDCLLTFREGLFGRLNIEYDNFLALVK